MLCISLMLDKTVVSGELWFLADTFFSFFCLVEPGDPGLLNKLLSQVHLNPAPPTVYKYATPSCLAGEKFSRASPS